MFTLASASALNIRWATPVWVRMPTPTTLTLDSSPWYSGAVSAPRSLHSWSTTGRMSCKSPRSTVKLMLAVLSSNTFWMMSSTMMLAPAMSPKIWAATPGRSGTFLIVTRVRSDLRAAPLTTMCSMFGVSAPMIVPGLSFWLLRTWMRTPYFLANSTARVCSTDAPRPDSSSISS